RPFHAHQGTREREAGDDENNKDETRLHVRYPFRELERWVSFRPTQWRRFPEPSAGRAPQRGHRTYTGAAPMPEKSIRGPEAYAGTGVLVAEEQPQGAGGNVVRQLLGGLERPANSHRDELKLRGVGGVRGGGSGRGAELERAPDDRLRRGIAHEDRERGETVLRLPRRHRGHAALNRVGSDRGHPDGGGVLDGNQGRSASLGSEFGEASIAVQLHGDLDGTQEPAKLLGNSRGVRRHIVRAHRGGMRGALPHFQPGVPRRARIHLDLGFLGEKDVGLVGRGKEPGGFLQRAAQSLERGRGDRFHRRLDGWGGGGRRGRGGGHRGEPDENAGDRGG